MRKFLITFLIFWCLYLNIRSVVKCQVVASYSNLCEADLTNKSVIYDSNKNIVVSCSLRILDAAEFSEAENDSMVVNENAHSWSQCAVSLKLRNCSWPYTFSTYFEPLQRVNPKVKIFNFAFSEPFLGGNTSLRHTLRRSMLDRLHELFSLDLSGNFIETLEVDTLDDLRRLREVDLSQNRIISMPDLLFQFNKHLKNISLAKNLMKTLPDGVFSYTTKLLFLNLSYNSLDYIGP